MGSLNRIKHDLILILQICDVGGEEGRRTKRISMIVDLMFAFLSIFLFYKISKY